MTQESPEQATNIGNGDADAEFHAMAQIYAALKPLDAGGRMRVLDYVLSRLGIDLKTRLSERDKGDETRELKLAIQQITPSMKALQKQTPTLALMTRRVMISKESARSRRSG